MEADYRTSKKKLIDWKTNEINQKKNVIPVDWILEEKI